MEEFCLERIPVLGEGVAATIRVGTAVRSLAGDEPDGIKCACDEQRPGGSTVTRRLGLQDREQADALRSSFAPSIDAEVRTCYIAVHRDVKSTSASYPMWCGPVPWPLSWTVSCRSRRRSTRSNRFALPKSSFFGRSQSKCTGPTVFSVESREGQLSSRCAVGLHRRRSCERRSHPVRRRAHPVVRRLRQTTSLRRLGRTRSRHASR